MTANGDRARLAATRDTAIAEQKMRSQRLKRERQARIAQLERDLDIGQHIE